jgi:PadR family transcriptional regulator PadR
MDITEKFNPIRKGLLEFVILRVIDTEKLYVAEMLKRLAATEFSKKERCIPC